MSNMRNIAYVTDEKGNKKSSKGIPQTLPYTIDDHRRIVTIYGAFHPVHPVILS